MEYQFTRDLEGRVHVRMSMDHEVIGYWFNEEVKHNLALLDQIEDEAHKLRGTENQWRVVGKEYLLSLTEDEVMIQANSLSFDTNDLEEGMSYYDVESLAFCGLDDFLELIKAYRQFHQEYC